jgi:hypothetical protein
MLLLVNLAACLTLGALRLLGVTSALFQGIAHIYVGGLFVYGWLEQELRYCRWWNPEEPFVGRRPPPRPSYHLWMAIALTAVEVFAFIAFKRGWLTH